jgi:hypothetical protein
MAISFDATSGTTGSGTTVTYSHTCSGTNTILFVAACSYTADRITGITYNGVSMTFINKTSRSTAFISLYYLINPSTGANNVVVSSSPSDTIHSISVSYAGVKQSAQPDNNTTTSAGTQTVATTLTTVASNTWSVHAAMNADQTGTPSASDYTSRNTQSDIIMGDTNTPKTPAGSVTMTSDWSGESSNAHGAVMASFTAEPLAFTSTTSEVVTDTDSVTNPTGYLKTVSETVTDTEVSKVGYGFSNQSRNSSSWTNQDKS